MQDREPFVENSDSNQTKAKVKKSNVAGVRVTVETRKRLLAELSKVNKKSFGRKVRVDQLINLLLELMKPEHIQKLQDESLSNADRIEMKFREYVRKNGAISKDDFLGMLLSADASKPSSENSPFSLGKS